MTERQGLLEAFEQSSKVAKVLDDVLNEESKKERSFDVFAALKQSDKRNFDYYDGLSEEAKKEFSPWMIQRWLANQKLEMVNSFINPVLNSVPDALAWRLFCAIGTPGSRQYKWDTPPKRLSSTKGDSIVQLVAQHYQVSTRVAKTYLINLTNDQILEIANLEGLDKKEITKIKKILK